MTAFGGSKKSREDGPVFACALTDADLVRACGPEQPDEVKVGQMWMRCEDGAELPVKRIERCRSRGLRVDLGGQSLTIVVYEHELRKSWVCTDSPDNVSDIDYSRRIHRG